MQIRLVSHGSDDYTRTLALRLRILREPLGLDFTPEDLAGEEAHTHIAAFTEDAPDPVGCLLLEEADAGSVHLRQMAVAESARRRGLGSALMTFTEDHARTHGKSLIFCHARYYAVPFYQKLGYHITGEPFEEVGMTHVRMEKEL